MPLTRKKSAETQICPMRPSAKVSYSYRKGHFLYCEKPITKANNGVFGLLKIWNKKQAKRFFQLNRNNKSKIFDWNFEAKIESATQQKIWFWKKRRIKNFSSFWKNGIINISRPAEKKMSLQFSDSPQFKGADLELDGRRQACCSKTIDFKYREKPRAMAFLELLPSHDSDAKLKLYDFQSNRPIKKLRLGIYTLIDEMKPTLKEKFRFENQDGSIMINFLVVLTIKTSKQDGVDWPLKKNFFVGQKLFVLHLSLWIEACSYG